MSHQHPPQITDIKVVGYYSINSDGEYQCDLSQLKYFKCPSNPNNINFDLNMNYHLTCHKPHLNIKMDFLINWCSENIDQIHILPFKNTSELRSPNFICRRGLLKTIFCTPYNKSNEWLFYASKIDKVIYLCWRDTQQYLETVQNETEQYKRVCTWGLKFEQFVMSDNPFEDPDPLVPLNENEKFHCMFKSSFGNHSLLYSAEIDGIISKQCIEDTLIEKNVEYIELKTIPLRDLNVNGDVAENKRYKLLNWWSQSYFVGIKKITFGCRDESGCVKKMKQYTMNNITRLSQRSWSDTICRKFLNEVLNDVKKTVNKNYDECLYKFSWDPKDNEVKTEELDPNTDDQFLPEWYINQVNMYKKGEQ